MDTENENHETHKEKTWTHIHFDLKEVDLNYLFQIKSDLYEQGVTFDTGTNIPDGPHEWHTDWSLDGPMDVAQLCAHLDVKEVPYTLVKLLNHNEE